MTSDLVAKTIMEQLEAGFNMTINSHKVSFFRFVGAEDMVYDDNSLMFFAHGGKYTHDVKVVIKLNVMDEYDIEFWKIGHGEFKKLEEHKGIPVENMMQVLKGGLGI